MDFQFLARVVDELSRILFGARVERVFQGTDSNLYFVFRKDGERLTVLISPSRSLPRMHLSSVKPAAISDPRPLVLFLRSRLVGTHVDHVVLLNEDRVVEFRFSRDAVVHHLIFELTGSSANLFFTDEVLRILALYYPVMPSDHARRILLSGTRYLPPAKTTPAPLPKSFPDAGSNISPNKSAEVHYQHLCEQQQSAALRSELASSIRKALARAERKRGALVADLQAGQLAEEHRQKGDLILANLQQLRAGMDRIDLTTDDGKPTTILLDTKRTPTQNAELYFKKYKKAKSGLPLITARLHDAEDELARLRSRLTHCEKADRDSLLELRQELLDYGYLKQAREPIRKAAPEHLPGVKKIVVRGWEILLGKNAVGNDYLTTRFARPHDLWLHAEGLPGSHVLVKNPQKTEIPPDILVKAASIAALYSKGKGAGKVPVAYTEARFVKKPKGAKPGLVVLSQRKTIMIEPAREPI